MMTTLIEVVKQIGGPGSIRFLVLCGAAGILMACIGSRGRRAARVWAVLVLTVHLVAGLPLVSSALEAALPGYQPVVQPGDVGDSDILVVLSGDNAQGRALETKRVLDANKPRCVLVSGSKWFLRMIVDAGVARERLRLDETANTTREQIAKLAQWSQQCGARRVVLIASTLSMPRVAALVQRAGVPVVLAASPVDDVPSTAGVRLALPSFAALTVTRVALYEHVALAYYRHRGWIS